MARNRTVVNCVQVSKLMLPRLLCAKLVLEVAEDDEDDEDDAEDAGDAGDAGDEDDEDDGNMF